MLFLRLIRVQWHQIPIHNSYCSLCCCFKEIIIYFNDCSIPLASLDNTLLRKTFDHLELFVPVTDSLWIHPIKWDQSVIGIVFRASRTPIFAQLISPVDPKVDEVWDLGQEIWFSSQYRVNIYLQVLPKSSTNLVQASHQRVAVAWVAFRVWGGIEGRLLDGVALVESISTTGYTVLLTF